MYQKKTNADVDCLQNYRPTPISNLSFLSKITEHIAFSRLLDYLLDNGILDDHQSAYRLNTNYSVETLLTNLSDNIRQEMDKGNVTAVVLLDM